MRNLWKANTVLSLLTVLDFYLVYEFIDKGNVQAGRIADALLAAAIAISALLFRLVGHQLDEEVDSFTIFLLASAEAIIALPRGFIQGTAVNNIAELMAVVCLLVAVWRERKEGESLLGCAAVVIPKFGVIIGAPILLYRKWQDFRETAGWI